MRPYHVDIYMPDEVFSEAARLLCLTAGRYFLSHHAEDRQREKQIVLPSTIPIDSCTIVEVTGFPVEKMLVRFPWGEKDIVMGLTRDGKVTTIYTNARGDTHRTLNPRNYHPAP